MDLNLREIRQFMRFLAETDIAEVEIKEEGKSLRIVRSLASAPVAQQQVVHRPSAVHYSPMVLPSPVSPPVDEVMLARENTVAITAPMVGTFYKAASPESAPFVRLGDMVKKGQVVCIIEAMKLMNEIESEVSGRVVSIVKENATPVEYGEEMFLVEPA